MDKTEIAQSWYDRGVRAYERDGKPITQTQEKIVLEIMSVSALACWYELRRIQDAERKKGVPIVLTKEDVEKWHSRSSADVFFTHHRDTMQPQISFYTSDDDAPFTTGPDFRFTNFRWRAGYPKGGNNAS